MNKQEFLDALRRELASLPPDELDEAVRYYDEYISEAGADEDVTPLIGSVSKVAEEFKKEYYDKKPMTGGELTVGGASAVDQPAGGKKRNYALYIVLGILIIGFGVPVLRGAIHKLPSFAGILIILALIVIVIKILKDKNASGGPAPLTAETCSDISAVNMELGAGKYVLRKGAAFGIDGGGHEVLSSIKNGVWYITDNADSGILSVTVPEDFTARELQINLGKGDLLIKDVTAYSANINVGAGRAEAENTFAQKIDIKCGAGSVKASLSVNGDVNVKCGLGAVNLDLKNPQSDFNRRASVGLGRVTIGNDTISGSGKINAVTGAFHNINADCGMGEIKITFE